MSSSRAAANGHDVIDKSSIGPLYHADNHFSIRSVNALAITISANLDPQARARLKEAIASNEPSHEDPDWMRATYTKIGLHPTMHRHLRQLLQEALGCIA